MRRQIIVGDVHGCLEELDLLLKAVSFEPANDQLVFVGDLIDRGPDPKGVLKRAQELQAISVLGNHEEKAIRWRKHQAKVKAGLQTKNPIQVTAEREAQWHSFDEDDWAYMERMPLSLWLRNDWWVVHAGCRPRIPVPKQHKNELLRLRYFYTDTMKFATLQDMNGENKFQPTRQEVDSGKFSYWTDHWTGPESIIYGHNVLRRGLESTTHVPSGAMTLGIDTGCVFGLELTALVWEDSVDGPENAVVVKAKKSYAELWESEFAS